MAVYFTVALLCGTAVYAAKHPKKEDPSTLPSDPNLASLRVSATMSLYELDASPEQLKLIKAAAAGAASTRVRTAAKGAAKLIKPMDELEKAILSGTDDGKIADLRNALVEAASADDVQLDDPVKTDGRGVGEGINYHARPARQPAGGVPGGARRRSRRSGGADGVGHR